MSPRRPVAERSDSGGLMLRFDDVLLVRGNRGTWLLDVQTQVAGAHRRMQIPIGRHKVFDRFAAEVLRADGGQSPRVHDESGR
ncbi:MAG TPA: hypothetical protein VND54_14085 [Candidatus Saccharimonadales bacterium]|nr:hypothetical protein [Candidatus Saccharimonadales bacterium]